jgi:hypothetical protein
MECSFIWRNSSIYLIKVSTLKDFSSSSLLVNDSIATTSYVISTSLSNNNKYFWEVAAKNAGGNSTFTIDSFTTIVAAPGVLTLVSPYNGVTDQAIVNTLKWNKVTGATSYKVQITTDTNFSNIVDSATLSDSSRPVTLANNTKYFWHVSSINAGGASAWSNEWKFTTIVAAPGTVTLTSPSSDANSVSITPTFAWNTPASGGTPAIYLIKVSTVKDFSSSLLVNDSTSNISYSISAALLNNTKYYWEVAAKNAGGNSAFTIDSITTIVATPGVTTLLVPADSGLNVSIAPLFSWNSVNGAVSYHLQVSTDSSFTALALVINDSTIADTIKSYPLSNDMKYFWRVNATNAGGVGEWSTINKFTTIVTIPSVITLNLPATGDTVKADSTVLSWLKGTPKIDNYLVQYASDSAFITPTSDSTVKDTIKILRSLVNKSELWWRVKAHNLAGWGDWSSKSVFTIKILTTKARRLGIPKTFSFSISSRTGYIQYTLPRTELVSLQVYSFKGQLLSEPVNKQQNEGYYSLNIQKNEYATGSYLIVFKAGEYNKKRIISIIK